MLCHLSQLMKHKFFVWLYRHHGGYQTSNPTCFEPFYEITYITRQKEGCVTRPTLLDTAALAEELSTGAVGAAASS